MNTRNRAPLVFLVASMAGCDAPVDDVPHDGADDRAQAGNYPDPITDVCDSLPAGVAAVPGLASAYALSGPRSSSVSDTPLDPSTVRVRLSSWAIAGDQLPPPVDPGFTPSDAIDGGWLLAFDLAPTLLTPGVYPLAEIPAGVIENWAGECDGDVCGGGGGGGGTAVLAAGELELFRVDAQCIIAEIRGSDPAAAPGLRDGGFVAERMAVDCVPVFDEDCDAP